MNYRTSRLLLLSLFCSSSSVSEAWQQQQQQQQLSQSSQSKEVVGMMSRRMLFQKSAGTVATGIVMGGASIEGLKRIVAAPPAMAMETTAAAASANNSNNNKPTTNTPKLYNLPNADLKTRLVSDIQDQQFLVTGRLSRELYDESATFTDEIDTYALQQWMDGTAKLFIPHKSHVELQPHTLDVTDQQVTFRFQEYLCFNIPLLFPTVFLTGTVILRRDPVTGLITSYQEQWDQDVVTVLKSAKFFA